jgi:hypothetical protein
MFSDNVIGYSCADLNTQIHIIWWPIHIKADKTRSALGYLIGLMATANRWFCELVKIAGRKMKFPKVRRNFLKELIELFAIIFR